MLEKTLPTLAAWLTFLDTVELPVLANTRAALGDLHERIDEIAPADLTQVICHDALLALLVFRFLKSHPHPASRKPLTSVQSAVLMTGLEPVLRFCVKRQSVEAHLRGHPLAGEQVRMVLQRSHLAALCAEAWAAQRHDIDTQEVVAATLLHDIAEVIVGCVAPKLILRIRAMQSADHQLRSHVAQKVVLGFPILDLQLALVEHWGLPDSLCMLMDEHHAEHPRIRTVTSASGFARHVAHGWDDPALPDDYRGAARACGISEAEARSLALTAALRAATHWQWYGTTPAAALLPLYAVAGAS